MQSLVSHLSASAALATLFFQLLSGGGLEHALVAAAVVAGAFGLVLTIIGTAVKRAQRTPQQVSPSTPRSDSAS